MCQPMLMFWLPDLYSVHVYGLCPIFRCSCALITWSLPLILSIYLASSQPVMSYLVIYLTSGGQWWDLRYTRDTWQTVISSLTLRLLVQYRLSTSEVAELNIYALLYVLVSTYSPWFRLPNHNDGTKDSNKGRIKGKGNKGRVKR